MALIKEKQPNAGSACNFTPSTVKFLKHGGPYNMIFWIVYTYDCT